MPPSFSDSLPYDRANVEIKGTRALSHEFDSTDRTIRLTIAYDGTAYCGWQIQPNGDTVQQQIETAIEKLTGHRSSVLCAGRTDSGVHALGQVASFRTGSRIDAAQFRPGLQNFLPDDIVLINSSDAPAEFHATHSTIAKRYRYVIHDGPILLPFLHRYVVKERCRLRETAMVESLSAIMGTHDFRCFESHFPNKATSIRTIHEAKLYRLSEWVPFQQLSATGNADDALPPIGKEDGPFLCFDIVANGFLYNMVRAIVGTLLRIGRGNWKPSMMAEIIKGQDRSRAGSTAPAHGLYLVAVDYPPDDRIAEHRQKRYE